MANTVTCDECRKEFNMKIIEKPHGKGLIETYFNCPHCKQRYNVSVTDAQARQEQKQINKLNDELVGRKQKLMQRMNRLENEIASS